MEESENSLISSSEEIKSIENEPKEADPVLADLEKRIAVARVHGVAEEQIKILEQNLAEKRRERENLRATREAIAQKLGEALAASGSAVLELPDASPEIITKAVAEFTGSEKRNPTGPGADIQKGYWVGSTKDPSVVIHVDLVQKRVGVSYKKAS